MIKYVVARRFGTIEYIYGKICRLVLSEYKPVELWRAFDSGLRCRLCADHAGEYRRDRDCLSIGSWQGGRQQEEAVWSSDLFVYAGFFAGVQSDVPVVYFRRNIDAAVCVDFHFRKEQWIDKPEEYRLVFSDKYCIPQSSDHSVIAVGLAIQGMVEFLRKEDTKQWHI